jgi:hypothetical protein
MAAAIAAAVVSTLAIRGLSTETRVAREVRWVTSPDFQEPTRGPGPVAAGRLRTQTDVAAEFALSGDAVERVLADTPQQRRDLVLSELLVRLVSYDAPAAARIAERETVGYLREVALRVVAQSWTGRDAAGALNWVASLSDPAERDAALENAALELVNSQPQRALLALDRRSAPRSPDPTLQGVVQQWATNDFAAAYAWAESQPAGSDRDALLMRLVFVRAGQNPADAARIANTAFSGDAQRIDALATLARSWGAQDPTAVHDLALSLDAKAQLRLETELALLE